MLSVPPSSQPVRIADDLKDRSSTPEYTAASGSAAHPRLHADTTTLPRWQRIYWFYRPFRAKESELQREPRLCFLPPCAPQEIAFRAFARSPCKVRLPFCFLHACLSSLQSRYTSTRPGTPIQPAAHVAASTEALVTRAHRWRIAERPGTSYRLYPEPSHHVLHRLAPYAEPTE